MRKRIKAKWVIKKPVLVPHSTAENVLKYGVSLTRYELDDKTADFRLVAENRRYMGHTYFMVRHFYTDGICKDWIIDECYELQQ